MEWRNECIFHRLRGAFFGWVNHIYRRLNSNDVLNLTGVALSPKKKQYIDHLRVTHFLWSVPTGRMYETCRRSYTTPSWSFHPFSLLHRPPCWRCKQHTIKVVQTTTIERASMYDTDRPTVPLFDSLNGRANPSKIQLDNMPCSKITN